MTPILVLDESSWSASASLTAQAIAAMEALADLLDVAWARRETVCRHSCFYDAPTGSTKQIVNVLFDNDALRSVDRDLSERLYLAVDRADLLKDEDAASLDASVLGETIFAPGVAWAHLQTGAQQAAGLLPLATDRRRRGILPVVVDGTSRSLHFITCEEEHVDFFRSAATFPNIGNVEFKALAHSAFPALEWLDSSWDELWRYRDCFFDQRLPDLVQHLAVLNDEAATLFYKHPGGAGVAEQLRARGVKASSENGNARSYQPSIAARTRVYRGREEVFWWHTKIQWDKGRIHFLHVQNPAPRRGDRPEHGHIVIGIFKDHCVLPG